jgi:hypothetical protein
MSRETQKRGILHVIHDLAEAGLMGDGDGQVQVVCILYELIKYIELCRPHLCGADGHSLRKATQMLYASVFARQWYESMKDVHVDRRPE